MLGEHFVRKGFQAHRFSQFLLFSLLQNQQGRLQNFDWEFHQLVNDGLGISSFGLHDQMKYF